MYEWVQEKYGRFFGGIYKNYAQFAEDCLTDDSLYVMHQWEENGVFLVDVCFDIMANEIIVIEEIPDTTSINKG